MKILWLFTFISGALTIYFDYFNRRMVYVFKPLTMAFIISMAWFYGSTAERNFYQCALLTGFVFSLIGDVLLINPQNFVFGLVSFLLAHLCYIAAFFKVCEGKFNVLSLTAFLIGAVILWLIYSGVPYILKFPVIIYALVISMMLALAFNFYLIRKAPDKALFALSGAFLFVVSDTVLAYNKFKSEILFSKLMILTTYFAAQWLIARSV